MSLPNSVIDFFHARALDLSTSFPAPYSDLFADGLLDSFALMSLISLLEEAGGITIPDHDIDPVNFQSLDSIENYLSTHAV
jgi:acyl carrier protein